MRATLLPFIIRETVQKKNTTIIYFHDPDPELFEKWIKALISRYNIISLKQYVDSKISENYSELPPKSLILTFDDGYHSNYLLKDILKKYNVPSTIFLCTGLIDTNRNYWFRYKYINGNCDSIEHLKKMSNSDRLSALKYYGFEETKNFAERQALSKKEIEDMKSIVDFQSHTMFHPILPNCSNKIVYEEVFYSKEILTKQYFLDVYAFSYPNGDYSDRDINYLKEAGYSCALTCDAGFNTQYTDLFKLKRMGIQNNADVSELLVKTCGLWGCIKRLVKPNPNGYKE